MDDRRFDRVVRVLAGGASRRRLIGGLVSSLAVGAMATGAAVAKPGKGKGKGQGKGKGKGNGSDNGNGNGDNGEGDGGNGNAGNGHGGGSAPGRNKVAICHLNDDGVYMYLLVPPPALNGHAGHGDVVEGVTGPESCDALNQPEPEPDPEA